MSRRTEKVVYGILTRFYFYDFLGWEFFNSHACLQQSALNERDSRHSEPSRWNGLLESAETAFRPLPGSASLSHSPRRLADSRAGEKTLRHKSM